MLEFYFLFNDGAVKLQLANTRHEAYQKLYDLMYYEFEDLEDFTEAVNFVEWLDSENVRNFYVAGKAEIERDDKPLFIKNYLKIDEVQPNEHEI